MPSRPEFVAQLQAAFPPEPIPPEGAFAPWGATYPDAEPYTQQLGGRTWEQLDPDYLVRRSDALGFLGTRHLIAVLPVYLQAMVENGVWSPATGMLTQVLAPPSAAKAGLGPDRFTALVDALTEPQRAAVASALRALAEQDPDGSLGRAALHALVGHWNSYLPATGQQPA